MKKILLIFLMGSVAVAAPSSGEEGWKDFDSSSVATLTSGKSEPKSQLVIGFGFEKRLESETNPVMEAREPLNVAIGMRVLRHMFTLEYSRFGQITGNETFHVTRQFEDLLGWYRYAFWGQRTYRALVGVGAGVYYDSVTTRFYDKEETVSSGAQWTAGTGLGFEFVPFRFVSLLLEARLIAGENLDPNPNSDFMARLSVQF